MLSYLGGFVLQVWHSVGRIVAEVATDTVATILERGRRGHR